MTYLLNIILPVLLACGALLLIVQAIGVLGDLHRQRERRHLRKSDFIDYFVSRGVSAQLAESVHQKLNRGHYFEFEPLPTDQLISLYGIDGSDFDELLMELANENGLKLPASGVLSIITVEDLLHFLTTLEPTTENANP